MRIAISFSEELQIGPLSRPSHSSSIDSMEALISSALRRWSKISSSSAMACSGAYKQRQHKEMEGRLHCMFGKSPSNVFSQWNKNCEFERQEFLVETHLKCRIPRLLCDRLSGRPALKTSKTPQDLSIRPCISSSVIPWRERCTDMCIYTEIFIHPSLFACQPLYPVPWSIIYRSIYSIHWSIALSHGPFFFQCPFAHQSASQSGRPPLCMSVGQ